MSSGVYFLIKGHREGEASGYVGQTVNFNRRYPEEVRLCLGAWVDVPKSELREAEKEAIEFCQAMGIPLENSQHNGGRAYSRMKRHDTRYT